MSLTLIASYLMYVLLESPLIGLLELSKNKGNVILYQNNIKQINNNKNNEEIEINRIEFD